MGNRSRTSECPKLDRCDLVNEPARSREQLDGRDFSEEGGPYVLYIRRVQLSFGYVPTGSIALGREIVWILTAVTI